MIGSDLKYKKFKSISKKKLSFFIVYSSFKYMYIHIYYVQAFKHWKKGDWYSS